MTNSNSNSDLIAKGALIWWTGIIVSDETWNKNIEPKRWSDTNELSGWGARYRVRIFGRHSAIKQKQPDEKLELCEVIFPVTAGTGHGASWQSPNLRQGSVVVGFYKDGIEANEPIIMGCIGNNEQTILSSDPTSNNGFEPRSGFDPNEEVAHYAKVPEDGEGNPATKGSNIIETSTGSSASRERAGDVEGNTEDRKPLTDCDVGSAATISTTIKNLILGIEKNRDQFKSWQSAVNKNDFADIQKQMNTATSAITGEMKQWMGDIQVFVEGKISATLREAFSKLNPSQQAPAQDLVDVAMQEIHCLFRRVIDGLFKIVGQFLSDNILKYVNAPVCAIENIVGTIIGNVVSLIKSGINKALEAISFVNEVIELGDEILGLVQNVLEFSFCDGNAACPDLKDWNIWEGADIDSFETPDVARIMSKANSVMSSANSLVDLGEIGLNLNLSLIHI